MKEGKTTAELAAEFGVHPNQISLWKSFFLKNAVSVFSGPKDEKDEIKRLENERDELHTCIGEKEMDIAFLKKLEKVGIAVRVDMISHGGKMTITKRRELLGVSHNRFYYKPRISERKLNIMEKIDRIYTEVPMSGQRKIKTAPMKRFEINAWARLDSSFDGDMQISASCPMPFLSTPNQQNKKHPCLLRNVVVDHVDQVWSTDITYIRLKNCFAYLTTVIDGYGRGILSWRLSTMFSTAFCEGAVREAIDKFGLARNLQYGSRLSVHVETVYQYLRL